MTLPNMTKEHRAELKALDRSLKALQRQRVALQRQEEKAIKAITRTTTKQIKGVAKEHDALNRRRQILVGRLS